MSETTWRAELYLALRANDETFDDIEAITLTDDDLDRPFEDGYGAVEGKPFTAWTARHVYFPAKYDGSEWVESVPRHPNGEPTEHIGG